jgi:hypothetical protein
VHKEVISVAVLNFSGKLVMESTFETKASTILDFLKGLRGSLQVKKAFASRRHAGRMQLQHQRYAAAASY